MFDQAPMSFEFRPRVIADYDDRDWAEWAEFSEPVRAEVAPQGEPVDGPEAAARWRALAQMPFARARFAEARLDGHLVGHAY